MKKFFNFVFVLVLAANFMLITSCSMKVGDFQEKTHFAFPNSNVTPLGNVQSSMKKTNFLFPPSLTADDIRKLMDDALTQEAGADLIVNYSIDTEITSWLILPIYSMEITLSGEAASMEVGMQELEEYQQKIEY
jgi:hypothetical protein